MRARLGFSIATAVDPDVLIIDEVLGTGDAVFRAKSKQRIIELTKAAKGIVLVTHDMTWVTEFCNRALLLDHGHVIMVGAPADVVKLHEERPSRPGSRARRTSPQAGRGRGNAPGPAATFRPSCPERTTLRLPIGVGSPRSSPAGSPAYDDPAKGRFVADQVDALAASGAVRPSVLTFDPARCIRRRVVQGPAGVGRLRGGAGGAAAADPLFVSRVAGPASVGRRSPPDDPRGVDACRGEGATRPSTARRCSRRSSTPRGGGRGRGVVHAHTAYPTGGGDRPADRLGWPLFVTEHARSSSDSSPTRQIREQYAAVVAVPPGSSREHDARRRAPGRAPGARRPDRGPAERRPDGALLVAPLSSVGPMSCCSSGTGRRPRGSRTCSGHGRGPHPAPVDPPPPRGSTADAE